MSTWQTCASLLVQFFLIEGKPIFSQERGSHSDPGGRVEIYQKYIVLFGDGDARKTDVPDPERLAFSGPAPVERIGSHPRSETSSKVYSCRWASQYCTFAGRSTGKTGRERLLKQREACSTQTARPRVTSFLAMDRLTRTEMLI